MEELINSNYDNYIKHIITPISPYIISDHCYSTEISPESNIYINCDINLFRPFPINDLYKNNDFEKIKDGDIVQVQVNLFNSFVDNILPKINKRIILITSQMQLPQLHKNTKTDECLRNDKIILWIAQNPIYTNISKYMAFPYGILQHNVKAYMNFLKRNNVDDKTKEKLIYNSHMRIHRHLPTWHIRRHPIFESVNKKIPYEDYLNNILNSKFTISTSGDRDDCYRHYECIGLNSIPISNINYKEIFGSNMIYTDIDGIIKMIKEEDPIEYNKPNRDIITLEYWKTQIKRRISMLKEG
jgi:hypothetical protein